MPTHASQARLDYEALSDLELAACLKRGDAAAVRLVTTRNSQRLYRTAWSILRNPAEAEDAVQEAYMKAIGAVDRFAGRSSLSTWLTRIVINEALSRRRANQRRARRLADGSVLVMEDYRDKLMGGAAAQPSPEAALARRQAAKVLETAIASLPESFRLVFVLRAIEGLSVEETAETLGVLPETVKTRHLRARLRLQKALDPELRTVFDETLAFAGLDCAAMTAAVIRRLGLDPGAPTSGPI